MEREVRFFSTFPSLIDNVTNPLSFPISAKQFSRFLQLKPYSLRYRKLPESPACQPNWMGLKFNFLLLERWDLFLTINRSIWPVNRREIVTKCTQAIWSYNAISYYLYEIFGNPTLRPSLWVRLRLFLHGLRLLRHGLQLIRYGLKLPILNRLQLPPLHCLRFSFLRRLRYLIRLRHQNDLKNQKNLRDYGFFP